MFRLFLVNLVKSGVDLEKKKKRPKLPPRRMRNRRIYERFNIDHKHLALMNDQDILVVRDLSERGFSTEVSDRCFTRMVVGDVYLCRLRYLGEVYECESQVIWKSERFVGFEITKASTKVAHFMRRLLHPVRLGSSMKPVPTKMASAVDNEGMQWFQGDEGTNLFVWPDDNGELKSWRFETTSRFIAWDGFEGLRTGMAKDKKKRDFSKPWEGAFEEDKSPDADLRKFAVDIFMALSLPYKEKLIASLEG